MKGLKYLRAALCGGSSVIVLVSPALADSFDVPGGDLAHALDSFSDQARVQLIYSDEAVRGHRSRGVRGELTEMAALTQVLRDTGFAAREMSGNTIGIVPASKPLQMAQAASRPRPSKPQAPVETVVVTAQKKTEDIQTVPIAVSAFSQKDLKERQVATGGDLIRETPNMNFTKTNFSGYSIELRGIGTQAISVTTDPAVAVAFNGIPFIRNHFFEQEFFDLGNVEILRGPQGTLYGRNATAGVVDLVSAKPSDEFAATGSVDIGNYGNRRFEAMLNLPIDSDKLDIRMAAEWTKRDGYTKDTTLSRSVDGRDLWSGRLSIGWKPLSNLQTYLVWEHFSETDDRLRSAKQLCKRAPFPTTILGVDVTNFLNLGGALGGGDNLSQGCELTSLYAPSAFEVPNGFALPYYSPLTSINVPLATNIDPYAETVQSQNLRSIQSAFLPRYRARNDIVEFNADYAITPALTLTSQTGFNNDFLWSNEDYNRFDTSPGIFFDAGPFQAVNLTLPDPQAGKNGVPASSRLFCDPQIGCSDRLVAEDLSDENAWQFSQEFRLASSYDGPLNFSVGANYLHYETEENYYVFINSLSLAAISRGHPAVYVPGVTTNQQCLSRVGGYGYNPPGVNVGGVIDCVYMDPNPIDSLDNQGHNYFLSQNPYTLNSYAVFGEAYYNLTKELKLTAGLRFTDDRKHFVDIPSQVLVNGYGYPSTGTVNQTWDRFTGRGVLDWTPELSFTNQSLFYASFAHGYKAGGANPPGPVFPIAGDPGEVENPVHPLIFKPEYIDAVELGTKNTLWDDTLTFNADVFYYNYKGYQISEIVDRTAINLNFNAHIEGAEIESTWEPLPGLKFNLASGWEDTALAKGSQAVDLMDRTAGNPNWLVVEPFPTQASNCIIPASVILYQLEFRPTGSGTGIVTDCGIAYQLHNDPMTNAPYVPNPTTTADGTPLPAPYPGFNPATAPNNGQGFDKNLSGHKLPNAPPFTLSTGAQYTMPVWPDWAATLRGDFYWQGNSFARVFNDKPYDQLHGYTNLNLALILNSSDGWQAMFYAKNVFNTTAITGDFLNSDDTGLTTNVFLTDPRLVGVRLTKEFGAGDTGSVKDAEDFIANLFADNDNGRPPLWIEFGADLDKVSSLGDPFAPPFTRAVIQAHLGSPLSPQKNLALGFGEDAKVSYQPSDSEWVLSAGVRYGRTNGGRNFHYQTKGCPCHFHFTLSGYLHSGYFTPAHHTERVNDLQAKNQESHLIFDFMAGRDVGLGKFTPESESTFSFGLRFVQFVSKQRVTMHADPDFVFPSNPIKYLIHHHTYNASSETEHRFTGIGPSISWKGSLPVADDGQGDGINFDWGANGALLFGRQKTRGHHHSSAFYHRTFVINPLPTTSVYASGSTERSKTVLVPNLGGSMGLSYRYRNAKVIFGYQADAFFGAMDDGYDHYRAHTHAYSGPFARISLGLGG